MALVCFMIGLAIAVAIAVLTLVRTGAPSSHDPVRIA